MQKSRLANIVFILLIVLFFPAWGQAAGLYEDGIKEYNAGNYPKAVELLTPFAEQGDSMAQSVLGLIYQFGKGMPADYGQAMKWHKKAARQGIGMAQTNTGFMYEHGLGVQQDYQEAVRWYRMAAEQGEGRAQLNLGIMYGNGQGVSQDFVQAHKWFNLSASNLQGEHKKEALLNREKAEKKLASDQIAEARKLAHEWKTKP